MSDTDRPPHDSSADAGPAAAPPPVPVPPYAAGAPSPYAASPGFAPHAQPAPFLDATGVGSPQQLTPGAPPTWGAPATAPPVPAEGRAMAITALVLAIVGFLSVFVPWRFDLLTWVCLITAITLGIAALARRRPGRWMSIAALAVSGVAALATLLWSVAFALFGSYFGTGWPSIGWAPDGGHPGGGTTEEYGQYEEHDDGAPIEGDYPSPPYLALEAGTGGATRADALPTGTTVTVIDENTGDAVWQMTVGAPEDISALAVEGADDPPANGAYLAVPIELTNATESTVDFSASYEYSPMTWLLTGDGGRADITFLASAPEHPALYDITEVDPGETVTFYDVYDVAPTVAGNGFLIAGFASGEQVFWKFGG